MKTKTEIKKLIKEAEEAKLESRRARKQLSDAFGLEEPNKTELEKEITIKERVFADRLQKLTKNRVIAYDDIEAYNKGYTDGKRKGAALKAKEIFDDLDRILGFYDIKGEKQSPFWLAALRNKHCGEEK